MATRKIELSCNCSVDLRRVNADDWQWNNPALKELLEEPLPENNHFDDFDSAAGRSEVFRPTTQKGH